MKKVLSLLLAVVLCLGLAIPAMAVETQTVTLKDENSDVTVTITNVVKTTEVEKTYDITVYWVLDTGSTVTFSGLTDANSYFFHSWSEDDIYEDDGGVGNFNGDTVEWDLSLTGDALSDSRLYSGKNFVSYGVLTDNDYDNAIRFGICYVKDDTATEETEEPAEEPEETPVPPVAEVPSDWAAEEVAAAIELGLVPENLQQNYTKAVARGDVAQMVINLLEQASGKTIDELLAEKEVEINPDAFADTDDAAVLTANALGIINGTGDSKFSPDGTFTRAQIAAIINRIAGVMGFETEGFTHEFTDVEGNWVDAELGWPVSKGIINGVGDNKFNPSGALTTEQAIAIMYRALPNLTADAE